jgi:hypothetical protein
MSPCVTAGVGTGPTSLSVAWRGKSRAVQPGEGEGAGLDLRQHISRQQQCAPHLSAILETP